MPLTRSSNQGAGERVFAVLIKARRAGQHIVLGEARQRNDIGQGRDAGGECAGFVDHQGVDPLQRFDCGGVAEQHPVLGGTAGRHHDRHRGGETEGAGAGNDQHRHRTHQAVHPTWLRAE